MVMLAYIDVGVNRARNLARIFIVLDRYNYFFQENHLNKPPGRRIAIAINTNCALTGAYSVDDKTKIAKKNKNVFKNLLL